MGIFDIFRRKKEPETRAVTLADILNDPGPSYGVQYISGDNDTGITVTPEKALGISAVYRGINIIGNAISSFPLNVFEETEQGKRKAVEHPAYRVARSPNDDMVAAAFWRAMIANSILYGNGYAVINTNEFGEPVELMPLISNHVSPERVNGELIYFIRTSHETVSLRPHEIIHIPMLSLNGVTGLSIIDLFRQSHGLSLASEKYPAKYFGNGASPKSVLQVPQAVDLSDKALENIKSDWRRMYGGMDNAHNSAVLPYGMDVKNLSHSPKEAMLLELREFQVKDVARILGIPPHMLGEPVGGMTYQNIETANIAFLQDTIDPWVVLIEQELDRKLIAEPDRGLIYIKLNTAARMRTDTKTRYESYRLAKDIGLLTVDEMRELEDLPPLDQQEPDSGSGDSRVIDTLESILRALAAQTVRAVALEMAQDKQADIDKFVDKYLKAFRFRAVNEKLDAEYETVRATNAFRREAYSVCGVRHVQWVGHDCCDTCRKLNNMIVDIKEPFREKLYHAPVESGCRCEIKPILSKGEKTNDR